MSRAPLAVIVAALWAIVGAASADAAVCDRACLRAGLDTYLNALTHHQPGQAVLAQSYRGTENGTVVAAGSGLWQSATALGALQRRYIDADTRQAAFYGLLDEGDSPAVVLLRLKFDGPKVVESEAVVARKGDRLYDPPGVVRNAPPLDAPVARTTKAAANRAALRTLADGFLEAMQLHSAVAVPHTADCVRLESGTGGVSASGERRGCTDGFEGLTQISAVAHRQLVLIDEPAGVVVGTAMFLRPPGATMPNGKLWKRNLLMNVFVAREGAISGVYGATHYLEAEQPETTGWPDR